MLTALNRMKVALFLLLAVPAGVAAMTVFDVIQLSKKNYSDQDIIALIEATDSAFGLQAGDITRLIELGVSEPVIQVMLKAVPAATPAEAAPGSAPGQYAQDPVDNNPGSHAASATIVPDSFVPRAKIDSEPLEEPGSGGHHHQVVTLSGIRLLVLRDEGAYSSVAARARTVVERLRVASAMDNGRFQPVHTAGGDAVVFAVAGTGRHIRVVSVSARDAGAYQRRSGRRVMPDLLAAYWSDLLTDYWSIALGDRPPDRLAMLHEGEALQELYDGLDASPDDDSDRLSGAFRSLPRREREHLLRLAVSVPRDFGSGDGHADELP